MHFSSVLPQKGHCISVHFSFELFTLFLKPFQKDLLPITKNFKTHLIKKKHPTENNVKISKSKNVN